MKNLLRFLAFVLMVGGAYAQSILPACPSGDEKKISNCWGRFVYGLGTVWVGELKGGIPNGEGIIYSNGGKVLESGILNGTSLISSYKIDPSLYPYEILGGAYAQSNLPACPSSGYFHNCFGTHTFNNGNKYIGEYRDDTHNGQGTLSFANGTRYVGEFKDDKYNGQGTLYASNGSVIRKGIWTDGKFFGSEQVQQAATPSVHPSSSERGRLASVSKLPACQTQS